MSQGSINMPSAPRSSPIEGILAGLQAAHAYYGIGAAKQASDLLAKQSDPNSAESKLGRAETEAGYDFAEKKGFINHTRASSLKGMIEGDGTTQNPPMTATALQKNPETSMLQGLMKGQQAADAMGMKFNSINDTKKEMQENSIHAQVLGKLDSNKALTSRLTQYQNLDNAYTNLLSTGPVTAQKIQDFQQGIIKNLGISGSSGVGERGERYYNSLDLKGGAGLQFLTGSPVDLSKSKFLPGLIDQAKTEQTQISGQMNKQIQALTSGHGSMYARRPDLKADLDQAISSHIAQFASSTPSNKDNPNGGGSPLPGTNAEAGTVDPDSTQLQEQHKLDPFTANFIMNRRKNGVQQQQ